MAWWSSAATAELHYPDVHRVHSFHSEPLGLQKDQGLGGIELSTARPLLQCSVPL